MKGTVRRILRALASAIVGALTGRRSSSQKRQDPAPRKTPRTPSGPPRSDGYPGDFEGTATIEYSPYRDDNPDPGEIVWAWIPYEEDASRGKDRPVLIVGRDGDWMLGLMLTSKDHDRDAADEARWGRVWMDIGTGDWDRKGRPSEVRLDRVVRVHPQGMRREGAVLDRTVFDAVARSLREIKGW